MFEKFKIVFSLFKKSFFMIGILYFVALVVFVLAISFKDAYKLHLENEFATKQPHIKIKYIDDNVIMSQKDIDKTKEELKKISPLIDTISEYVDGEIFVNSVGEKNGGNALYQGEIKVIGLNKQDLVYNFFDVKFSPRDPFNIRYTPLEFLYFFYTQPNAVIFNKTLNDSYFPVIESVQNFSFQTASLKTFAKLAGVFDDYDTKQILYTNVKFANHLLGNNKEKISGYFINANKVENIEQLISVIKKKINRKKFIVTSWLEEKKKQHMIFSIFKALSYVIIGIVLLLSLLFNVLLIYDAIVKKSYQLRVFLTMGYILKKEIFIILMSVAFIESCLVLLLSYHYMPLWLQLFGLPYQDIIFIHNIIYVSIVFIVFLVILYFFIKKS